VPQTKVAERINAARRVVQTCWFDETACGEGLDGLSAWSYEWSEETRTFSREPRHDWASHPGDAFSYGCQVMELNKPKPEEKSSRYFEEMSLNELWTTSKSARKRI